MELEPIKCLQKMINNPKFITFEGGEGSGKTTQSKMLYEYLISKGIKAIHTREVGGTPEAERIRDILVNSELYPMSELMLVMAARYEHVNKVIIPALEKGMWVICDRFVDSTVCYQAEECFLADQSYQLHPYNSCKILPDITFFMDISPDISLLRALNRKNANKFENKDIEFHKKIYQRFHHIAAMCKNRIVTIECKDLTKEEIHQKIISNIF